MGGQQKKHIQIRGRARCGAFAVRANFRVAVGLEFSIIEVVVGPQATRNAVSLSFRIASFPGFKLKLFQGPRKEGDDRIPTRTTPPPPQLPPTSSLSSHTQWL